MLVFCIKSIENGLLVFCINDHSNDGIIFFLAAASKYCEENVAAEL